MLHLNEQCEASCCKATDGSGAEDKCKEEEKVGGGEGLEVVEAKAQAHRRQGSGCPLKQVVDQLAFKVGRHLDDSESGGRPETRRQVDPGTKVGGDQQGGDHTHLCIDILGNEDTFAFLQQLLKI